MQLDVMVVHHDHQFPALLSTEVDPLAIFFVVPVLGTRVVLPSIPKVTSTVLGSLMETILHFPHDPVGIVR